MHTIWNTISMEIDMAFSLLHNQYFIKKIEFTKKEYKKFHNGLKTMFFVRNELC